MAYVFFNYPVENGDRVDGWDVDRVTYDGYGGWPWDRAEGDRYLRHGEIDTVELTVVEPFASFYCLHQFPGIHFSTSLFVEGRDEDD